jgi:predicted ribonuclease YlaK
MSDNQQIFTSNENGNRIINVALHLQAKLASRPVILVSKGINKRLKAKGAGMDLVGDYRKDQLISGCFCCPEQGVTTISPTRPHPALINTIQKQELLPLISSNDKSDEMYHLKEVA